MYQPNINHSIQSEGKIAIATQALERGNFKTYDQLLQLQRWAQKSSRGTRPRHDREPNSDKLTKLEESVIEHILDLDSRGFAPK